jgi:hypothetical protein
MVLNTASESTFAIADPVQSSRAQTGLLGLKAAEEVRELR